ncbi:MAG: NAD(P)/FAD-dependent oxidoreductase [Flavobacteriaceae bacterium]
MIEYIVVGLGLAGLSFCECLERDGKSFRVISDHSQNASRVAGGLYNPVILKRFTLAWQADTQLKSALPFYGGLGQKLRGQWDQKLPVYRRFASIEEQNGWFQAADRPRLQPFLSTHIHQNKNPGIHAPFGFGEVLGTGKVHTAALLDAYTSYLDAADGLIKKTFAHDRLEIREGYVKYGDIKARNIVFAEGYGLKQNPYFNYLPLLGTKGELLTIEAPALKEKRIIKSSVFAIPLGNDLYQVGATYKWKDKTDRPTLEAREELLQKMETFMTCGYKVVDQVAGIRPTVTDRRPLVGTHPQHGNLHILNGFGSRGVLIAPMASRALYDNIERNTPLPEEMDIRRFAKKWEHSQRHV